VIHPAIFLFVPAHDERKVEKALASGSDAVILDLEDSVPSASKPIARRTVRDRITRAGPNPAIWVRVNATLPEFEQDLHSIDWPNVGGVVLPKVESTTALSALERAGAGRVLLLVESAAGLHALPSLIRNSNLEALTAIGTWDLALDLGLLGVGDPDESELIWHVRRELVIQARLAKLPSPIDGVYAAIDDDEGLAAVCKRAFRIGYGGKLLVHPRQVPIARSVFAPNVEELQLADQMITAYEDGVASGRGAVRVNGRMVDLPMVERARALSARFGRPPR